MHNTIAFVIPEFMTGVGGIESIVINLAREASSEGSQAKQVIVICPESSFVAQELAKLETKKLKLLFWGPTFISIPGGTLLVNWGGYTSLARIESAYTNVVTWAVMPNQAFSHLTDRSWIPGFRSATSRIVRTLDRGHSLVVMDAQNRDALEAISGEDLSPPIVPVPIPVTTNQWLLNRQSRFRDSRLTISWIGRGSVDWKIFPLINILNSSKVPGSGLVLKIFTDTTDRFSELLNEHLQDFVSKNLQIEFRIGVFGDTLRTELANDSDVHLGMGTSLLEGASVGVPSICVDPQCEILPSGSWRWFHECASGDLGRFNFDPQLGPGVDFSSLLLDQTILSDFSHRSYLHSLRNFSSKSVLESILNLDSKISLKQYLSMHPLLYRMVTWVVGATTRFRLGSVSDSTLA